MTRTSWMFTLLAATVLAAPASAQTSVDKTVPFELDKWYELNVKEGPITLHRIRLERGAGGGLKSRVTGGEDEYHVPVKAELEYSNAASSDWRVVFRISWVDESGEAIDGYNGSHQLSEKKDFERASGTVTTLRYGLARAKKLRLLLNVKPD
jgi:hypothetical protein